jgi:glycosyltransferase involved in cell wall biosynthesis
MPGSSNRVPELLNAMDVYVLPSIAEGIANSLLEAMATGLPVIATAVGGNPEVIVDGESGLLFPSGEFNMLAEHLGLLKEHPEWQMRLAEEAVCRIRQQFSIDSMIQKYSHLYESVVSGV